jgi:hypothetical protein
MANINGWGRGTWGQLTFGEPLPVAVTGVVGTTALDDGTAVQAAAVTGVSAVASASTLGDESVSAAANVAVTGNVGTSALGTESLITNNNLDVTGFAGTSALGSVTPNADAIVTITEGFEITSALNTVNVWGQVAQGISTTYTPVSTTQTPNWQEVA